jgi:hypothetical protein
MVTGCEEVYFPAPGLKVGVAVVLLPVVEEPPPHPAMTKTIASPKNRNADNDLTLADIRSTLPPR